MNNDEQRLAWARETCCRAQLRRTVIRDAVLGFLARRRRPVTLSEVAQAAGISGKCDSTTVYRTLMTFNEVGVIRLVGTPDKASQFILNVPGETVDYLICRSCGVSIELPACHSHPEAETFAVEAHGFGDVYHELRVYGICPECQKKGPTPLPSKIPARFRK